MASAELQEAKQKLRISSTLRRSDGVRVRAVAEQAPAAGAVPVAPNLEDAYLAAHRGGEGRGVSALRRFSTLVLADVRERSRRFSFLVTLAVALWAGYAFLPPQEARYVTLRLGEYRGIYNSAWVGAAVSLLTSAFLGLVGFYLVRDSVSRDVRTGVGQLLAATPLSRLRYLLSKAFSNWIVLGAIALAVALSGAVMQWTRAEDRTLDAAGLLGPFLFLTLPALAFVAALAVFFECVPGLRGGGGNVLYFFVWSFGLAVSGLLLKGGLDFPGMGLVLPSMEAACAAAFPAFETGRNNFAIGVNVKESGVWSLQTFVWPGIEWTRSAIAGRGVWLLLAFGVVALRGRGLRSFCQRYRRLGTHAEAGDA